MKRPASPRALLTARLVEAHYRCPGAFRVRPGYVPGTLLVESTPGYLRAMGAALQPRYAVRLRVSGYPRPYLEVRL